MFNLAVAKFFIAYFFDVGFDNVIVNIDDVGVMTGCLLFFLLLTVWVPSWGNRPNPPPLSLPFKTHLLRPGT